MQNDKPLAFYSRKMNNAQQKYTTGEQELLSIVETLKEFKNILLGQSIIIYTDHKNILYGNLANDRIARWRLLIEEFSPEFKHIPGKSNIVADALSRMEASFEKNANSSQLNLLSGQLYAYTMTNLEYDQTVEPIQADLISLATALQMRNEIENEKFPWLLISPIVS